MSIKDKTVLVTGANRGIGQALTAEAAVGPGHQDRLVFNAHACCSCCFPM